MLKLIKKVWHDPVGSTVIATVIVAVAAYFLPWRTQIWQSILIASNFLVERTFVPNWVLIILSLVFLLMVLLLVLSIWSSFQGKGALWKSYTSDNFFGIKWCWRYSYSDQVEGIYSLCPQCNFQVYPQNVSAYRAVDRIGFTCESCNTHLGEFNDSYDNLENKIQRLIQQKLRNENWS